MTARLDAELLITAGVEGLPHLNRLIDTIEDAGGNTDQLRAAAARLSREWDNMSADEQARHMRNLSDAANRSADDLGLLGRRANVADGGMQNLGKTLAGFAGAYVGIDAVTDGIRSLVNTSKELDSLNQKLEYATGSAAEAGKTWDYLKGLANELGLEQIGLANGYAQLASATKNLNMSQEDTKLAFEGVANASAAMSLTTDEANGVFLALSQIAGKGKVSMEELRGQLGERLTPAMGIAAQAMDVTTAELEKMVENGIDATEFLPKFGNALTQAFGEQAQNNVKTTTGAINELTNKTTNLKEKLLDGFAGEGISSGINLLSQGIDGVSTAIDNIDPATIELMKNTFEQFGGIAQTTFTEVMSLISGIEQSFDAINVAINGTAAEAEKFSVINSLILGVNISLGALNDGIKTIGIAFDLARGVSAKFLATTADGLSKITFGELSASLKRYATEIDASAGAAFDSAQQKALDFESSAVQAMQRYAQSATDNMGSAADAAVSAYQQMIEKGTASAAEIEAAFAKMAQAQIDSHGVIALEAINATGAEQGLKAAVDETGDAIVEKMSAAEMASAAVKQQTQELDNKFKALAKTVGYGLSEGFVNARQSVTELYQNFDLLKGAGYEVGEVTTAALIKMANEAKNTAEIENLKALIVEMGQEGKLAGEDIEMALEATQNKADQLTSGINSINEAFKVLGVTTRQELAKQAQTYGQAYSMIENSGQATTTQLTEAFRKYARSAIAANDGVVDAQLQAQAEQQGLTIAVDETGRVTFESMRRAEQAIRSTKPSVDRTRAAIRGLGDEADNAGRKMVDAARDGVREFEKLKSTVDDQGRVLNDEGSVLKAVSYDVESAYQKLLRDLDLNESVLSSAEINTLRSKASEAAQSTRHLTDPYRYGMTNAMAVDEILGDFVKANKNRDWGQSNQKRANKYHPQPAQPLMPVVAPAVTLPNLNTQISASDVIAGLDARVIKLIKEIGVQEFAKQLMDESKRRPI